MSTQLIDRDDVRARVRDLPKLPQVVHEVTDALANENLCLEDFSSKLAIDPATVAVILRAANSPFYGMSGSIATLPDAIRLVGLRAVATLITTGSVLRHFKPPRCRGFDFRLYCEHSLATAICAQEFARVRNESQTIAFTAGLLHDIGKLVLATYYPELVASSPPVADCSEIDAGDPEIVAISAGHAEIGAWVAEHWHFAANVCESIRYHHAPQRLVQASLVDIVHAADGVVHALDLMREERDAVPRLNLESWERLALQPAQVISVFERTEQGFAALRDAFIGLNGPGTGPH